MRSVGHYVYVFEACPARVIGVNCISGSQLRDLPGRVAQTHHVRSSTCARLSLALLGSSG